MCEDFDVQNAFALLDMEDEETISLPIEKKQAPCVKVTREEAMSYLQGTRSEPMQTRDVVRDAFDGPFYFFALFSHCIDSGLVRGVDDAYPARVSTSLLSSASEGNAPAGIRTSAMPADSSAKDLRRSASIRSARPCDVSSSSMMAVTLKSARHSAKSATRRLKRFRRARGSETPGVTLSNCESAT
jgi:hypothetical protein